MFNNQISDLGRNVFAGSVLLIVVACLGTLSIPALAMTIPTEHPTAPNTTQLSNDTAPTTTSLPLNASSSAPPVTTQWNQTYNGKLSDYFTSITQTADGGYLLVGSTGAMYGEGGDGLVVKIGANGTTQWNQTYGGSGSDAFHSITQTADGDYFLAGITNSFGSEDWNGWVVKIKANGITQWNQTYGGNQFDEFFSITQTDDGDFLIVGETASFGENTDGWVTRIGPNGTTQWNQTYGETDHDRFQSITQTANGNYLIGGVNNLYGDDENGWVVQIGPNGTTEWNQTYGGSGNDRLYSITQSTDGEYFLAGMTNSFGGENGDGWVVKIKANGNTQWNQTYGGNQFDRFMSITQATDEGHLLVGDSGSRYGDADGWVVRIGANGTTQWNQTYGGNKSDRFFSITQTADGRHLLAGITNSFAAENSDAWVVKIDTQTQTQVPPPVVGNASPTDPDDNGTYEDVDGNSDVDARDVLALWNNRDSVSAEYFDFDNSGTIDARDVLTLWNNYVDA